MTTMRTFPALIALFALLLPVRTALACDCLFIGTFCESITSFGNNGQINPNNHIDHVLVTGKDATGISVLVLRTFFGDNLEGQTLEFKSGNGGDCRRFLDDFQVGEQHLFSGNETGGLWSLSDCGVSSLPVVDGVATGPVAPGVGAVALTDLGTLSGCGSFAVGVLGQGVEPVVRINASLPAGEVLLYTTQAAPQRARLQVFDAAGRLVEEMVLAEFNTYQPFVVDLRQWSKGVYFFQVSLPGGRHTFRVLRA